MSETSIAQQNKYAKGDKVMTPMGEARVIYVPGEPINFTGTVHTMYTVDVAVNRGILNFTEAELLPVEKAAPATPHPSADLIRGLRELADFLERTPALCEAGIKHRFAEPYSRVRFMVSSKEAFAAIGRHLGSAQKVIGEHFFELVKDFPGGVRLEVSASRDIVCKKVVTGTKQVERFVRRADLTPAEEAIVTNLYTKQVVEEEVTEWQCEPGVVLADVPAIVGGAEDATK